MDLIKTSLVSVRNQFNRTNSTRTASTWLSSLQPSTINRSKTTSMSPTSSAATLSISHRSSRISRTSNSSRTNRASRSSRFSSTTRISAWIRQISCSSRPPYRLDSLWTGNKTTPFHPREAIKLRLCSLLRSLNNSSKSSLHSKSCLMTTNHCYRSTWTT